MCSTEPYRRVDFTRKCAVFLVQYLTQFCDELQPTKIVWSVARPCVWYILLRLFTPACFQETLHLAIT